MRALDPEVDDIVWQAIEPLVPVPVSSCSSPAAVALPAAVRPLLPAFRSLSPLSPRQVAGREGEGRRNGTKTPDSSRRTHPPSRTGARPGEGRSEPGGPGNRGEAQRASPTGKGPRHRPRSQHEGRGGQHRRPSADRDPKNPPTHPGPRRSGRAGPAVSEDRPEAGRKAHRRPRPPTRG